jgi:hypothetical protein
MDRDDPFGEAERTAEARGIAQDRDGQWTDDRDRYQETSDREPQ